MKYGIFYFPTAYSMRADQLARAVKERAFDSIASCRACRRPKPGRWRAS
jgi:hypothetical protein